MNAAFVVKELAPSYNNFRSFQHQRQRNAATSTYHRSKTYDDSQQFQKYFLMLDMWRCHVPFDGKSVVQKLLRGFISILICISVATGLVQQAA